MELANPLAIHMAQAYEVDPDLRKIVDELHAYARSRENGEVFDTWDDYIVKQIIAYNIGKGTILYSRTEDTGEINGLAMWYHCNQTVDWDFVKRWHPDDPEGDAIFIAFLFSDGKDIFKRMTRNFLKYEPTALDKTILGLRRRNNTPTRVVYPRSLFTKILTS
jgi:hypothetical protein